MKYHNPTSCNVCRGRNDLFNEVREEGVLMETETRCTDCGRLDYWAHGFFASSMADLNACEKYAIDNVPIEVAPSLAPVGPQEKTRKLLCGIAQNVSIPEASRLDVIRRVLAVGQRVCTKFTCRKVFDGGGPETACPECGSKSLSLHFLRGLSGFSATVHREPLIRLEYQKLITRVPTGIVEELRLETREQLERAGLQINNHLVRRRKD